MPGAISRMLQAQEFCQVLVSLKSCNHINHSNSSRWMTG